MASEGRQVIEAAEPGAQSAKSVVNDVSFVPGQLVGPVSSSHSGITSDAADIAKELLTECDQIDVGALLAATADWEAEARSDAKQTEGGKA